MRCAWPPVGSRYSQRAPAGFHGLDIPRLSSIRGRWSRTINRADICPRQATPAGTRYSGLWAGSREPVPGPVFHTPCTSPADLRMAATGAGISVPPGRTAIIHNLNGKGDAGMGCLDYPHAPGWQTPAAASGTGIRCQGHAGYCSACRQPDTRHRTAGPGEPSGKPVVMYWPVQRKSAFVPDGIACWEAAPVSNDGTRWSGHPAILHLYLFGREVSLCPLLRSDLTIIQQQPAGSPDYSGITISGGAGAGVGEFWCSSRCQPLLSLRKTLVP